jgi:RNAse (barnase) inhibitor barstar
MIDIKNFSDTETLYRHLFKELDLDEEEFPTEKQDVQ